MRAEGGANGASPCCSSSWSKLVSNWIMWQVVVHTETAGGDSAFFFPFPVVVFFFGGGRVRALARFAGGGGDASRAAAARVLITEAEIIIFLGKLGEFDGIWELVGSTEWRRWGLRGRDASAPEKKLSTLIKARRVKLLHCFEVAHSSLKADGPPEGHLETI